MHALVQEADLEALLHIESAGTGGWHAGELPDPRSRAAAAVHGIKLDSRAQQFTSYDFDRFEWVIALDTANEADLKGLAANQGDRDKIYKLRFFDAAVSGSPDVPDPYYTGPGDDGFETVYQMCRAACVGLLAHLRQHYNF